MMTSFNCEFDIMPANVPVPSDDSHARHFAQARYRKLIDLLDAAHAQSPNEATDRKRDHRIDHDAGQRARANSTIAVIGAIIAAKKLGSR